jgi:hypothetical protein
VSTQDSRPSSLMLEECFAAENERFLEEWVRFNHPEFLSRFLERWLADSRPWTRQQIVQYLHRDLNFPGHEVVIKRMCKHFFTVGDHELLAHFMVAFDRMVRRRRIVHSNWNLQHQEVSREERLTAKPNRTIQNETGRTTEWGIGKFKRTVLLPDRINKKTNRLFSHRTRNHLRRRIWRYFRWLSYRDADAYASAMTTGIIEYRDADFSVGENIIDNWSLMHVCYFHSDIIRFNATHANLNSGHSLADLSAAPYQPEIWQRPEAAAHLIEILLSAHSVLARVWAIELLQREHGEAIARTDIQLLMQLLAHTDPRVQQFAADVFPQHQSLATLLVTQWLELLERCDHAHLPMICEAMKRHVAAVRLDTPQLIQLTSALPVPVAEFGFQLLQIRHDDHPLTPDEITSLSRVGCESLAGKITTFALRSLGGDLYHTDKVIEFFDSLSPSMRSASMDWLEQPTSHGHDDPVLWARLIETPFDEMRLRIVDCLHRRTQLPGTETDTLAPIWCAVILGVHRGGRSKLKAMIQMQAAILQRPARAAELLPVLAVAVRSLRAAERRGALAALAGIVTQNNELQADIRQLLPELQWI